MAVWPCGPVLSAQYSRVGVHVCVGVHLRERMVYVRVREYSYTLQRRMQGVERGH